EFRRVSDGAGSAVRPRQSAPADRNRHRPPRRCVAWLSRVPNDHLVLQFNAISFLHAFADVRNQRKHVLGGGAARVDKEIGVAVADPRIAHGKSLESQFVNHASGGSARRVLENAAGTFLAKRLAGAPFFVADTNTFEDFFERLGG